MPAVVIIGEAPGHATPPGRVFALAGAIRKVRRVRSRANAAEYTRLFRNRRQTRGLVEIVTNQHGGGTRLCRIPTRGNGRR
jgi:hypothetical protein